MALWQAVQCKFPGPVQALPNADASTNIPIFGDFVIPAGFAAADIIEMTGLPAGYVPWDVTIASEGLGTTLTADVGLMSGDYGKLLDNLGAARTCGAEFMAAKALAPAGIYRMDVFAGAVIAPTLGDLSTTPFANGDRGIGIKATAIAALTAGKKIRLQLLCRPRVEGV